MIETDWLGDPPEFEEEIDRGERSDEFCLRYCMDSGHCEWSSGCRWGDDLSDYIDFDRINEPHAGVYRKRKQKEKEIQNGI